MAVSEKRKLKIQKKLSEVTDQEWEVVFFKCREHVKIKLHALTLYGAHSQTNLGSKAEHHYVQEAALKLLYVIWEWQFEKFSLVEQMVRVIDSMISNEVDKAGTGKKRKVQLIYDEEALSTYPADDYDYITDEKESEKQIELVTNIAKENPQHATFFALVLQKKSYDEISVIMSLPKKKVYKICEQLKAKVIKSKK